ncbi:DUF308 domain-containing protein [Candidatus Saccharibacteria bacterium]|nr:DUF308 domain-containing protein [Candidatus Saccharibacteria bacterium]
MNKLVKRGFNVWLIFIKNKIASSIMMLMGGAMMLIGALQGKGNDTITLPLVITLVGAGLAFWALYRLGYLKSNLDNLKNDEREEKVAGKKMFWLQVAESLLYCAVSGLGIFLLINTGFTNIVLNLMAGFFTTLNGVLNIISTIKNRDNKDFRWKLMIVVMACELILGPYFLISCTSISINGYIIMGALTSVAGAIEVINAITRENIRGTINDGKEIVRTIKGVEKTDEEDTEEEEA